MNFSEFLLEAKRQNTKLSSDKDVKRLSYLSAQSRKGKLNNDEKKELDSLFDTVIAKYNKVFEQTKNKFKSLINKVLTGNKYKSEKPKILIGTKPISSIKDKTLNRGKSFIELGDIVRGAVLFKTDGTVDRFTKDLLRKYPNYAKDMEKKMKGGDSTYGYYGSSHLELEIDGIVVELQVMTQKLWNYKTAAHEIYNANRSKSGGPSKADSFLSKKIFKLGNNESEELMSDDQLMEELNFFEDIEFFEVDIEE